MTALNWKLLAHPTNDKFLDYRLDKLPFLVISHYFKGYFIDTDLTEPNITEPK